MAKHKVLLTGFGPFPGVPENATAILVPAIATRAAELFPDVQFETSILPVEWDAGPTKARQLLAAVEPDVVLHFGVSDRADEFHVETVAHNACLAAVDACGALPASDLLDARASETLAVTLPTDAMVERLRQCSLPAELSNDAGGYLCNAVLFSSLAAAKPHQRIGFIHVPDGLADGQAELSMDQAVVGGLELITCTLAELG
ncbi:MAG: pyroglutamyl-peptidase I [Filomicrobium sp.]